MSLTYSQAPYVRTNAPGIFAGLITRASTETIRLAVVGDSRWTFPGGSGGYFQTELQAQFCHKFGQLSETTFATPSNFLDPASTGARFAIAQAVQNGATQYTAGYFPPGYSGATVSLLEQSAGGGHGVAQMLDPSCASVFAAGGVALKAGKFFDSSPISGGSLTGYGKFWGITYAAGGESEFAWRFTDNTTGSCGYFGTTRTTGSTSIGLDASGFALKSALVPYTCNSSSNYPQFVTGSKNASPKVAFFGLQFVSATKTNGITCFPCSAGGYLTSHFISLHAESQPFWRDFPFSAIVFGYGTNDADNTKTATEYKTAVLANIDFVRAVNPLIPIFLVTNPYSLTVSNSATEAQYAGVLNEIVDMRSNICFINTRRMLDEQGFNSTNTDVGGSGSDGTWLLADGLHMTAFGQRVEATCIANSIMGLGVNRVGLIGG